MIRATLLMMLVAAPFALARPNAPRAQRRLEEAGIEGVTLVKAHKNASQNEQWADMRLTQGRPALAVEHARACLVEKPGGTRCLGLLLRSLAAAGGCDEALSLVPDLRTRRGWDADMAEAESKCWLERGGVTAAVEAMEEAALLSDNLAEVRFGLFQLHLVAGMSDLAAEDLVILEGLPERGNLIPLARATLALETGDPAFDELFAELKRAPQYEDTRASLSVLHALDGVAWLDAGDPVLAEQAFSRAIALVITQYRFAALRAEAFRRDGDLDSALTILGRPWLVNERTPLVRAIRVRVLTDAGRFAEARAVLDELPGADLPEILASRYYLARATGDAGAAARFAAEWGARNQAPQRSLAQLEPLRASIP
jgi:hypothetical protein